MNFLIRYQNNLMAAVIFCGGLLLFTTGLAPQEIIGFESRFYLFALEMWRHGVSWFPTTYGQYYPDYPVTSTLLINVAAHLTGQLNKFSAILPTAIAAALTLSFTYLIGALIEKRWGWYAVFLLLLTNTFIMEARTISPDQFIAMLTSLAFYLVFAAQVNGKRAPFWSLLFIFVAGFAVRGPIGLVVPTGVICVFYLLDRNYKQFYKMGFSAVALLALCTLVLLSIAYHVGGWFFVHEVMRMQVFSRLGTIAPLPWYFYFYESWGAYALTFPLAVLVALGLTQKNNSAQSKALLKFAGWAAVVVIGLTIPSGKKVRYILAAAPALSLLSASLFLLPQQKYFALLRRITLVFLFCLPLVLFIMLGIFLVYAKRNNFTVDIAYVKLLVTFAVLFILSVRFRKTDGALLAFAALAFSLTYIGVAEPVNQELNETHDFVMRVEQGRLAQGAVLVFYNQSPDRSAIKYLVNMPREEKPLFFNSPTELEQYKQPAYFIIEPRYAASLPKDTAARLKQIYAGNIGTEKMLVFTKA